MIWQEVGDRVFTRRFKFFNQQVGVDTHWHFDHAFGNSVFRPASIWGHARTVDRLLSRGQATIEEVAAELPAIAAKAAFDRALPQLRGELLD